MFNALGKVLIDGDIIAYRAAYSTQDKWPKDAIEKVDELVKFILNDTIGFVNDEFKDTYQVYLTGKGNFRFDIAKSAEYKGNRKGTERPIHLDLTRDHLINKWGAVVSEGEEADDLIAIEATRLGSSAIVASIDKDMLQIPCRHFNFGKGEWQTVSQIEGLKFFYKQILTGDRADNIIGLNGYGPVKAGKLIDHCVDEDEMWTTVLKEYNGDEEHVVENARLLWFRRKENQLWQPPHKR